ncbi:MAG TPA: endolytic transglycosylase MltG [Polyangiaceae bacterium]|nr:endolytic transglycosylase MltG [Polyangiaceae bacterium]
MLAAALGAALTYGTSDPPSGGRGRPVELAFAPGASWAEVADALGAAGLVSLPSAFAAYARARGGAAPAGKHFVPDDLRPAELYAALTRSPSRRRVRVTWPEGATRFDVARRLGERGVIAPGAFLEASADRALLALAGVEAPTAEGYLFPDTYEYFVNADAASSLAPPLKGFRRALERLRAEGLEPPGEAARALGWSTHEAVTLASMVEKEASADDERPLVASVFYNRFRSPAFAPKPPRLQSDPTAAYGCLAAPATPSCAGFAGRVTPAIAHDPANPYSTYAHAGLPPGPIANPGLKALRAAMAPASTGYLYFVAAGGGRHTFSATLGEHNAAVRQLRGLRGGSP